MAAKWIKIIIFTLSIVTTDLGAKIWIQQNLELHQEIEVIPDLFNVNYLHNPGSAFGLFADAPPLFRTVFFSIVTMAATIGIAVLIYRSGSEEKAVERYALAAILGGAIANGVNRLQLGHVVDFLHLHWKYKYHYPSFNIADIAICAGVLFLILKSYLDGRNIRSSRISIGRNS